MASPRKTLLACLALGWSSVACRTSQHTPDVPEAPLGSKPASDAPPDHDLPMPPGLEVSFERALLRVTEVRGLRQKGSVHGLRVKRSDLLDHVERAVDLETPPHALLGTEAMLVGLGVVPSAFEYRATMLRLLSEKLAGLYDPHLRTMMILDDLKDADREMTLLHELVHALQDQHYDLDEIVGWTEDDTDRSGALSCLAEGDATSAMFDGMLGEGQTALSLPAGYIQGKMREAGVETVPPIIDRSLKAPYIDGVTFVHALRRRGGWSAVDDVWKDPPQTSEQILHLEKYDAREPAIIVALPQEPGDRFKMLLHDVWGEQNLRLVLEEWLPESQAAAAAAGWGGDRIAVWQKEGRVALAWHVHADSEKDAVEIEAAFVAGLTRGSSGVAAQPSLPCGTFGDSGATGAVSRRGRQIFLHTGVVRQTERQPDICPWLIEWIQMQP